MAIFNRLMVPINSVKNLIENLPTLALCLAATIFINRIGGMAKFFMPMYLRTDLHIGIDIIGWLLACYGIGTLAGSYINGILSDYVSPRRLVVVLLTCSGVTLLCLGVVQSVEGLAVMLFIGGSFDGGVRPVVERLIMESCTESERPLAQSLNRVAINLAFSAAGLIAGALASFDYRAVFIFDGICNILAALWLSWVLMKVASRVGKALPHAVSAPKSSVAKGMPYTDLPFMIYMAATLLVALMYITTNSLLGNYLKEYHQFGPAVFGWQCALNGLLVVLLQIPLTNWSQHWGERWQVTAGVCLAAIGLGILPFCTSITLVSLSTIVWTVGEMLFMPTMSTLVMLRAEGKRSGHYFGLQNAIWSASVLIAPVMGSYLYAQFGGHMVWYICAILGFSAVIFLHRIVPQLSSTVSSLPTPAGESL